MNAIINAINLAFAAFILTAIAGYRVGSRCGFPGLPHDTSATPSKRVYEDGDEVVYSCPKDKIYLKTQVKRCEAGSWVGNRSTCGLFSPNQLMSVEIVDLKSGAVVYEGQTKNYTNTEGYPTSFYDNDASNVLAPNADSPRKWYFTFKNRQSFDFFLLNLKIPNTKFSNFNLIDKIRVKDVTVESAPDRNCQLDFSTRRHSAKIFWFWCTSSANASGDGADRISFVTSATEPIENLGLHQVYFTKLFYCGQPEVSLLAEFINGKVQCDSRLSVSAEPEVKAESLTENFNDYEYCTDDPYWAGKPKCLPKQFCSLDFDHKTDEILSVQNAYKLNETEWYAIEGTVIEFKCKSGYKLLDSAKKVCRHDFKWDFEGPVCGDGKSLNLSTILVIVGILIILVPIVVLSIVIYRRKQARHTKNKLSALQKTSDDYYDSVMEYDCNHYAEPYYEETPTNRYEEPTYSKAIAPKMDSKAEDSEAKPETPFYLQVYVDRDNCVSVNKSDNA